MSSLYDIICVDLRVGAGSSLSNAGDVYHDVKPSAPTNVSQMLIVLLFPFILVLSTFLASSTDLFGQTVVAWGRNDFGQSTVPDGLTDVTAVSAGGNHNLALRANGTVVAWGSNQFGQRNVPLGIANVIAVAAGGEHSLALLADGTVRCWGWNISGQCNIPSGLSQVVAISANGNTSMALKSDGTVVAWGDGSYGQTAIPPTLTDAISVAAGVCTIVLRSNGSILSFGGDAYGECSGAPSGLDQVIQVAAGRGGVAGGLAPNQTLVLRSDGSLRVWGSNSNGINSIPTAVSAEAIAAVAAGSRFNLVLTRKGQVLAWGSNEDGQTTVPAELQSGTLAVSAGSFHGVAIRHNANPSYPTATNIELAVNPAASGETYSVQYQVSSSGGVPSGTITIKEAFGGNCTGAAPSGTCTISAGRLGTHLVTASFLGNGSYSSSRGLL